MDSYTNNNSPLTPREQLIQTISQLRTASPQKTLPNKPQTSSKTKFLNRLLSIIPSAIRFAATIYMDNILKPSPARMWLILLNLAGIGLGIASLFEFWNFSWQLAMGMGSIIGLSLGIATPILMLTVKAVNEVINNRNTFSENTEPSYDSKVDALNNPTDPIMRQLADDPHFLEITRTLTSFAEKPTFKNGVLDNTLLPEITTLDAAQWTAKKRESLVYSQKSPEDKVAKLESLTAEMAKEKINRFKNTFH